MQGIVAVEGTMIPSLAYVDTLTNAGIGKAALYSRAGDSVWAQSSTFNISAPEIAELVKGFDDPSQLQASGLHIQGEKYFLLRADDRSIYGKKGEEGIIAVRTKQALIIAHYGPPLQPGAAATTVEKLADYLISVGY